jgi:hypothetical protein
MLKLIVNNEYAHIDSTIHFETCRTSCAYFNHGVPPAFWKKTMLSKFQHKMM